MCAHSDTRSKLKYLAYFPVQGVFRASGMDVTLQETWKADIAFIGVHGDGVGHDTGKRPHVASTRFARGHSKP
jgi:hypothetical protein